jgi:aspartate/methionine/tyrosine aminotransferase
VISDEIYEKLVYDEAKHYSIGSFSGMEDLTRTVNGFSKAYSMTGWRLGYATASKEIMDKMLIIQQHTVTHPAAFVEKAGITALRECGKYVEKMVRAYQTARDYFVPELNKLGIFRCDKPKGAFYAFPKITAQSNDSSKLCDSLLDKARVLAVPGSGFGNCGEGYVRLVYAQEMSTLKKAIESIKRATG